MSGGGENKDNVVLKRCGGKNAFSPAVKQMFIFILFSVVFLLIPCVLATKRPSLPFCLAIFLQ